MSALSATCRRSMWTLHICRHPRRNTLESHFTYNLASCQYLERQSSRFRHPSSIFTTMNPFAPPPKPKTALGWHRVLSPTANVKVSPIALGGISIGNSWSALFGRSQDPFSLLDAYYDLGGNFIDTANTYNSEESEKLIGEWMEKRAIRDQMVVATKYGAGYRAYNRENEPLQSNFTGPSAKSMHISVRESLRKLRTDYIDILYVHWYVIIRCQRNRSY
jgi:hypothetical protein